MFLNNFFTIKTKLNKSSEYSYLLPLFSDLNLQGLFKLFYFLSLDNNCSSIVRDIIKDKHLQIEQHIINNKTLFFKKIQNSLDENSFSKKESLSIFDTYINLSSYSIEELDITFYLKICFIETFNIENFLTNLNNFVLLKSFIEPDEAIGILLFIDALTDNYNTLISEEINIYKSLSKSNFISTLLTLENFNSEFRIRKHLKILQSSLINI